MALGRVHFLGAQTFDLAEPGPGKLPIFGVRENPKIRPQIRTPGSLKSAHLDRDGHVIPKKRK